MCVLTGEFAPTRSVIVRAWYLTKPWDILFLQRSQPKLYTECIGKLSCPMFNSPNFVSGIGSLG